MSRKSSVFFSPAVRLQAEGVWEAAEFLLNGLVFILIGLQLPYVLAGIKGFSFTRLVLYGLAFSAVLVALRLVWSFPGARLGHFLRAKVLHQKVPVPDRRQVFVLGWTGMRGVVALAAAGSLPYTLGDGSPFPQRNMILFLTFSVILVTLVIQGLTLPFLVRLLGLADGGGPDTEQGEARRILLRAALDFLRDGRALADEASTHAYDDLIHQYQHQLQEVESANPKSADQQGALTLHGLLLETVQHERKELNVLRDSGRIGDTTHRLLERELDLSESRLSL